MKEGIEKRFVGNDVSMELMIGYILDSEGTDLNCFFTFDEFMTNTQQKYPNVKFVSFADQTEGVASLIYMLASERIATPTTTIAFPTTFNSENDDKSLKELKNKVTRVLFGKGYKTDIIKICLPDNLTTQYFYCRNVCESDGISTKYITHNG